MLLSLRKFCSSVPNSIAIYNCLFFWVFPCLFHNPSYFICPCTSVGESKKHLWYRRCKNLDARHLMRKPWLRPLNHKVSIDGIHYLLWCVLGFNWFSKNTSILNLCLLFKASEIRFSACCVLSLCFYAFRFLNSDSPILWIFLFQAWFHCSFGFCTSLFHVVILAFSVGNRAMQSKLYPDAIELYTFAISLCEDNAVYYCNRWRTSTHWRILWFLFRV